MSDIILRHILRESPGKVGDPEIWIGEAAAPENGWIGATLSFLQDSGREPSVVYRIESRRYSTHNGGQPYYVARWPD